MSKNIYSLDLHERLDVPAHIGTLVVTRVPGGWIYQTTNARGTSSAFVPLHDEFRPTEPSDMPF